MLIPAWQNLLACLVGVASSVGACGFHRPRDANLRLQQTGEGGKMPGGEGSGKFQIHVVDGSELLYPSATCSGHQVSRTYVAPVFQELVSWSGK